MTRGLEIKSTRTGSEVSVTLGGVMDEEANYGVIELAGCGSMSFDMGEVDSINSIGTQVWVRFLQAVPKGTIITFERCPVMIVNQMNMLPAFFGGHLPVVTSIFAPYFCETCDDSRQALLTVDSIREGQGEAPSVPCPGCGASMTFDEDEGYFQFLRRTTAR